MEVEGDLAQAVKESDGDNILTPEQENSNSGTVELRTVVIEEKTVDEAGEEITLKRQIKFSLNGNSDVLSGRYSGTWVGPGLYCRSGLQGTIVISRRFQLNYLSKYRHYTEEIHYPLFLSNVQFEKHHQITIKWNRLKFLTTPQMMGFLKKS